MHDQAGEKQHQKKGRQWKMRRPQRFGNHVVEQHETILSVEERAIPWKERLVLMLKNGRQIEGLI